MKSLLYLIYYGNEDFDFIINSTVFFFPGEHSNGVL
jgi:hypothetical protein